MSTLAQVSRIPVATGGKHPPRPPERFELCEMQKAPAPIGRAVPRKVTPHWSATFADAINTHIWRKEALDAFESHSFTGKPGTERWCTRCTLMLPPDWKDPKKPVPLPCGDPRIRPVPAMYAYVDGNPLQGVRLADPAYSGAKVKNG